jgi:hypothetical protein
MKNPAMHLPINSLYVMPLVLFSGSSPDAALLIKRGDTLPEAWLPLVWISKKKAEQPLGQVQQGGMKATRSNHRRLQKPI